MCVVSFLGGDAALTHAELEPHISQRYIQRMLKNVAMGTVPRKNRRSSAKSEALEFQPIGIPAKETTSALQKLVFLSRQFDFRRFGTGS
jgi:hypothetical protein